VTSEFTYELTDELMRRSTRRWLQHYTGRRVPITLAVLLALLVPICLSDDEGYVCGFFFGALALLAVLVTIAYLARDRAAVRMVRQLPTRSARCTISEEGMTLENALAKSTLKWPLFQKVVRAPDVWLFFISKQQFFALPADKLSADVRAFIESRVGRMR
jgi:YcxB-like protein